MQRLRRVLPCFTLITLQFIGLAVVSVRGAEEGGGDLFQADFDSDTTGAWIVNQTPFGLNAADFFFDYSTVGIEPAPNPLGVLGTTRGLKMGVNLDPLGSGGPAPVINVSPIGQFFDGDYEVRFDWWTNYIGPLDFGAFGSTNLSTFGIMTSGVQPPFPNTIDSITFAAAGDGQSATDFRITSPERVFGGYVPNSMNPLDANATFLAGSRQSTALLYGEAFPSVLAPLTQEILYPTQFGVTQPGTPGFRWNEVVIRKEGAEVTWTVNGVLLAVVNLAAQTVPTGGGNILFGHADVNGSTSSDPFYADLNFTLIDNVVVRVVPEPTALMLATTAAIAACALRRRYNG